jgi:hypothetical protein
MAPLMRPNRMLLGGLVPIITPIGILLQALPSLALPPPSDPPEEVLRTEIIGEARSAIDGQLLTAQQYAQLQAEIEAANQPEAVVPEKGRQLIGLLRLRKLLKTFLPFIPIK